MAKTGRKKLPKGEKAVLVGSYHKLCDLQPIGGLPKAREISRAAIEREIRRSKKII